MVRFIMPIIFIGIAIGGFFILTSPIYQDITEIRVESASYDEALSNSKALENERDKLTSKFNAISKEDLIKLEKLLPDNIDNIRLILEIEKIASPYGMVLKDVKYNANEAKSDGNIVAGGTQSVAPTPKDYRVLDMEFSVTGTYSNFINFTKDLESNLRIIDISSVVFTSDTVDLKTNSGGSYKYNFKIKTYWLKS